MSIKLIFFEGCPNAKIIRDLLEELGMEYQNIDQLKLEETDVLRKYSSPTLLKDGKVIFGTPIGTEYGGCSVESIDKEKLIDELLGKEA